MQPNVVVFFCPSVFESLNVYKYFFLVLLTPTYLTRDATFAPSLVIAHIALSHIIFTSLIVPLLQDIVDMTSVEAILKQGHGE